MAIFKRRSACACSGRARAASPGPLACPASPESSWSATRASDSPPDDGSFDEPLVAKSSQPSATRFRRSALAMQAAVRLQRRARARVAPLTCGEPSAGKWRKPRQTVLAIVRMKRAGEAQRGMAAQQLMALLEPGQRLGHLSDFAKEYGDEAFCRRLLRKYDGNMRRCTQRYVEALQWREANEELLTTRRYNLAGDYRVIGADVQRRPVLYMCMKNQLLPNTKGLDQSLVCMLQAIDNMPEGVEKTTHIWDLHGMSVRLNLNPAAVGKMLQAQEGYFAERMHELIIIDMPSMAGFIKDAVWPLVPEKTRRKVRFLTPAQAQEHFRSTCETQTAGRICDAMDQNRARGTALKERMATWRRMNEHGELVPLVA